MSRDEENGEGGRIESKGDRIREYFRRARKAQGNGWREDIFRGASVIGELNH